jgi:hypothetical protein
MATAIATVGATVVGHPPPEPRTAEFRVIRFEQVCPPELGSLRYSCCSVSSGHAAGEPFTDLHLGDEMSIVTGP